MFVLGTAGHVDHGKSTLLRAVTGMEPDRLPEEKARGLTINLNFLWSDFSKFGRVGFVDVPGHHRFLGNMISGVGEISAFLLVIACDDGWMPQTEEHLRVLKSFGIEKGICILSKTDLVTEERVSGLRSEVTKRWKEAFGYQPDIFLFSKNISSNIATLRKGIEALLDSLNPPSDETSGRVWVDRVFTPKGLGVIATGTLTEGPLQKGDELYLWPARKTVGIRAIQSYENEMIQVNPVSRVALQLSQLEKNEISPGSLLSREPISESLRIDVNAFFFRSIKKNQQVKFYLGTLEEKCLLIPLHKDQEGIHRLQFARPVPLRFGDAFVLRTFGEEHLLGGGWVVDPLSRSKTHRAAITLLSPLKKSAIDFLKLEAQWENDLEMARLKSRSAFSDSELKTALSDPTFIQTWEALHPPKEIKTPQPLSGEELKTQKLLHGSERIWSLEEVSAQGGTKQVLRELVKRGEIVELKNELYLSRSFYKRLEEGVRTFLFKNIKATTSELKAPLGGVSRKYAIPLLEKMDENRLTYLKDGVRRLLK